MTDAADGNAGTGARWGAPAELDFIGGGYGDADWIDAQFAEAGDAGVGCRPDHLGAGREPRRSSTACWGE